MNAPRRWSDPKSDVDPVVRSVVRYGQGLGPDAAALRRLILATAERPRVKRPLVRRFVTGVALGLAGAVGGAAWANHSGWFSNDMAAPAPKPSASAPAPAITEAWRIVASAPLPTTAPADAEPSTARTTAQTPQALSAFQSRLQNDSELLQDARTVVSVRPEHALRLLRDHELRFPNSALTEERRALRIEALASLGRRKQAAAELTAFEGDHPRSPYRRRLRTLVGP